MRWIERRSCHFHPYPPPRTPQDLRFRILVVVTCALLMALLAITGASPIIANAAAPSTPSSTSVGSVRIVVNDPGALDANAIVQQYGPAIQTAITESSTLFAVASSQPVTITFVTTADPKLTAAMRPIRDTGWASIDGSQAIVLRDRFTQLTAAQAQNLFRNIISRPAMQAAAGGHLPAGLMDGTARYFERPILAEQARAGSLVQAANQSGILPDFAPLVNLGASTLDFETATATRYALVAFIVDRYGIGSLQRLVQSFASPPVDWQASFTKTLGQPVDQLQSAWREFLPRWFASGWQSNAIDAFDVAPAQALFDRGAYAAAADRAALSQKLFTELGDQQRLSSIETLLALCAVGVQAETLMTETQQALTSHDYARAKSLLAEADQQYALLPDAHRPTAILDSYHQVTDDGIAAIDQYNRATDSSHDWRTLRSSRADALAGGSTFARLGDTERAAQARDLLSKVDTRVHRLALILATLGILLSTWFGIWMWSRAPQRFAWTRLTSNRKGVARWSRS